MPDMPQQQVIILVAHFYAAVDIVATPVFLRE